MPYHAAAPTRYQYTPGVTAPRADHAPALDGVRGVAVALVILQHWEIGAGLPFDRGLLGVRLFFVLSGYLITTILLQGRALTASGEATLGGFARAFYARRFLRLLPLYYATLAALWAADVAGFREELVWHATHNTSLLVARTNAWIGYPSHFWSLSVEEHFYLLWPWAVLLTPRRALPWMFGAVIAAGMAWRSLGALAGLGRFALLHTLPGCLDPLAVGALLAWVHRERSPYVRRVRRGMFAVGAVALALASAATRGAGATAVTHVVAGTKGTAYALLLGALVSACAAREGALVRAMSWRPLAALGRVSYAVYIVHPMVFWGLRWHWPALRGTPALWGLSAAITLGFAAASWRWFEGPLNARKARFPYRADVSRATGGS